MGVALFFSFRYFFNVYGNTFFKSKWMDNVKARSFNITLRLFPVSVLRVFCFFDETSRVLTTELCLVQDFLWLSHLRFRSFTMENWRYHGLMS